MGREAPPIDEDEVARLYNSGSTIRAIAEQLHIRSPGRVRNVLHNRDDVVVRNRGLPWVNTDPGPVGASLREQLDQLGITYADASRRIGVSPKHLSQVIVGRSSLAVDIAVSLTAELKIDGRALLVLQAKTQFDQAFRLLTEEA